MKYLKTFNESSLPEGMLINTVKNLEVPEELEDLISSGSYFRNRIIANIDGIWFDYNKGFYSDPEWSHIDYSTYTDPHGVRHKASKEEVERIIFEQDVIPGSEKDSESKAFKKWLLSQGLNVKEVYLGET